MVVLDNGFVGINTGSAAYNLDVNGTTRVQNNFFINSGFAVASLGNSVNLRSNLIGGSGYVVNAQSYNTLNSANNEQGFGEFTGIYAPTSVSGTPSFNALKLTPTINQTGGANGITRGLLIEPTITSATDFRTIETVRGNNLLNSTSGNTYVGLSANNGTAKLQVRGSGATSATTALRVENSNASASLVVLDDGNVNMYNNLTVTGSISTSTNTTGQSTLGTGLVVNNTAGSSSINDFQVKTQLYNAIYVTSSADSMTLMSSPNGKLGFFGATPTTQSAGWSVANYLVSKSFDANTVTLEQLADVVGTILTELKNKGLLG